MRKSSRLMRSTRAATAVEYGLILALVFLAAVGAISQVGTATINIWTNVSDASSAEMYGAGCAITGPRQHRRNPRSLSVSHQIPLKPITLPTTRPYTGNLTYYGPRHNIFHKHNSTNNTQHHNQS